MNTTLFAIATANPGPNGNLDSVVVNSSNALYGSNTGNTVTTYGALIMNAGYNVTATAGNVTLVNNGTGNNVTAIGAIVSNVGNNATATAGNVSVKNVAH